jgi:ubiquinone/menaquinone biosynthesis C-methylase UbiE
MQVDALHERLNEIDAIADEQWMASLTDRKRKELEFHDADRDAGKIVTLDKETHEKIYGNRKYYDATGLSKDYVDAWIRESVRGKVFLDYACGNGRDAIKAAKWGAALSIGLDISRVSVENAKREAAAQGVQGNTRFVQADAENTMLPDNSVDLVICSGMLHHLDLSYAFPELRRILKPGGRILAMEALNYNPAIKLYRYLTPEMRTEWEKKHILSFKDIRFARSFFTVANIRYWHIASLIAPYARMMGALPALNWLDNYLTRIPLLRLMAWIFTFELIKPVAAGYAPRFGHAGDPG